MLPFSHNIQQHIQYLSNLCWGTQLELSLVPMSPKDCIKPLTSCLFYLQIVSGLGSCPAAAAEALSSSLEVSQETEFVFFCVKQIFLSTHALVEIHTLLCWHCGDNVLRVCYYNGAFCQFAKGLRLTSLLHNCELENWDMHSWFHSSWSLTLSVQDLIFIFL